MSETEAIPFVTEILQLANLVDLSGIPLFALAKAGRRGKIVHDACEAIDRRQSELLTTFPDEYTGYVDAYESFKRETGFVPRLIEHEIRGDQAGLRFVGRCDRTGIIDHGGEIVLDIKTSYAPSPSWSIQTAAYARGLWGANYSRNYGRAVVHLHKIGKYDLLIYEDPFDDTVWEAALTIAHWKLRHGAKLTSELRENA